MTHWRALTPVFATTLSETYLNAHKRLFAIGNTTLSPGEFPSPHWHDSYEIGLIMAGKGLIVMGAHEYRFQAGQVYIINDIEPHMGYSDSGAQLLNVHFHPKLLNESWVGQLWSSIHQPFFISTPGPLLPVDDPFAPRLRSLCQRISLEARRQGAAWELIVGGLIIECVGLLTRRLLAQPGTPNALAFDRRQALQRIAPSLALIDQRYAQALSLHQIAAVSYLSRSHCCALFRQALDTTPIAYRNQRRLSEAQRLLRATGLTVQEICFQVGFHSLQEFNRLFKRQFHTSPKRFRAHAQ